MFPLLNGPFLTLLLVTISVSRKLHLSVTFGVLDPSSRSPMNSSVFVCSFRFPDLVKEPHFEAVSSDLGEGGVSSTLLVFSRNFEAINSVFPLNRFLRLSFRSGVLEGSESCVKKATKFRHRWITMVSFLKETILCYKRKLLCSRNNRILLTYYCSEA